MFLEVLTFPAKQRWTSVWLQPHQEIVPWVQLLCPTLPLQCLLPRLDHWCLLLRAHMPFLAGDQATNECYLSWAKHRECILNPGPQDLNKWLWFSKYPTLMITKLLSEKRPHCFYIKLALYIRKKNNLRLNTVDTAHFLNRYCSNHFFNSSAIQDMSLLRQHRGLPSPPKVMNIE